MYMAALDLLVAEIRHQCAQIEAGIVAGGRDVSYHEGKANIASGNARSVTKEGTCYKWR
jgi:hypothetical protein